jgi:hypothetical protein
MRTVASLRADAHRGKHRRGRRKREKFFIGRSEKDNSPCCLFGNGTADLLRDGSGKASRTDRVAGVAAPVQPGVQPDVPPMRDIKALRAAIILPKPSTASEWTGKKVNDQNITFPQPFAGQNLHYNL